MWPESTFSQAGTSKWSRVNSQQDERSVRQTQTDWHTDGQSISQTDRRTDRQTNCQADRQTDGQTDRQTERQTDKLSGRQTDSHTDSKKSISVFNLPSGGGMKHFHPFSSAPSAPFRVQNYKCFPDFRTSKEPIYEISLISVVFSGRNYTHTARLWCASWDRKRNQTACPSEIDGLPVYKTREDRTRGCCHIQINKQKKIY